MKNFKRYKNVIGLAFCAVCYGLLSISWFYLGFFREQDISWFDVALGLVWLVAAVIWIVRTVREYRKTKE
jgi:membrane protein YdbS with pleckstrin-like domain